MAEKQMSKEIESYFQDINKEVKKTNDVANKARKKGLDPEDKSAIPLAKNMAERVEGLISAVAPQIIGSGISKRIPELEKLYGSLDWRVALVIAEEIANEKFCKFENKMEAITIGIRVGFAYLTLGSVASPLEGFVEIKIGKTSANEEYFDVYYSGPVRSAGGTAAAVSVVLIDYIRKKLGYAAYDPTEKEVLRMITEVNDYHERVTNLQYKPSEEELKFLLKHMPVQINGDPSEKIEVSNHKDLKRIATNRVRNGPCLVVAESLAQKAPKVWTRLSKWAKDFDLENWAFLEEFVKIQKKMKSGDGSSDEGDKPKEKITPVYTYIQDLVAGRPVLTHPLRTGGFRLRYGRCRNSGYSSACLSPLTTLVLNRYIGIGTQLKVERPGKAASMSVCDSIDGPIVKLKDGSVVKIETEQKAKEVLDYIDKLLYLGDILFNYGDFFNRAHILLPAGYCEEWWIQELEKATVDLFGNLDLVKLSGLVDIPTEELELVVKDPLYHKLSASNSISLSEKLGIPLHPRFTYYWKSLNNEGLFALAEIIGKIQIINDEVTGEIKKLILPLEPKLKQALEDIGIPHSIATENVILEKGDALAFAYSIGLTKKGAMEIKSAIEDGIEGGPIKIINLLSGIKVRDKSGTFVGARMGRPEKAKIRKLTGSPHVLFPVGEEGGKMRCFQSAFEAKKINSNFPIYHCNKCEKETIYPICETCDRKTKKLYFCKQCGIIETDKCDHGDAQGYKRRDIDINYYFNSCLKKLGIKAYPDMIKGVKGTSNKDHIPEHLMKGILRAKHEIYVNKDGTTRHDMTQLALTHFKPMEVGTTIEKLKEIGYTNDIKGNPIENENQVLELKPQDIVLPSCNQSIEEGADHILFRVANFVDDCLKQFYGTNSFYNLKSEKDLVGQLVVALAPHTSAGIVCRIVGFSKTQGFYAHPMVHAATRRDCDGDEASVVLLLDAMLNFSRQYLPNTRGATQDAPLVLTSNLVPAELDDMVFDMDVAWKYSLDFYEACEAYKYPWDVDVDMIGKRLNKEGQYEGMGFTHPTRDINSGVRCSAYKTLPSMEEKLKGQMDLAEKIVAVDESDVARLVIEKHFIRDIRGNLRKFSQQMFRCVACNEKFRRPPLVGKCTQCGGKIIFTISQGSIVKYLEPAISLAEKYNVRPYLKQSLELTKRHVECVFGRDKEKQAGLGAWF